MSHETRKDYTCDNCGRKLPTDSNNVVIVTSKDEHSIGWSRLRVIIEHYHGSHNDGETDPADLCKKCTIALLSDALARVKKNERVSAGVDAIGMLKFNQTF